MNRLRIVLLASCLFSIGLISACKTTENQIRFVSPELLNQARQMGTLPMQASDNAGTKPRAYWFLVTAVLTAGAVVFFTSGRSSQKKRAPATRGSTKKRRKR